MARAVAYPFSLAKLPTPAFCVDRSRLARNCEKMRNMAKRYGLQLRPHMKSHKTVQAGVLMTGGTMRKIVVSTLAEAEFFAAAGFDDILYGYPLTPEKMPRCRELANKLEKLHVLTDSEVTVNELCGDDHISNRKWSVLLSVDCGNNREGIHWEDTNTGASLAAKLTSSKGVGFAGIYTHCGDSYYTDPEGQLKVTDVAKRAIERMLYFADGLKKQGGVECPSIGIGSTPSCSHSIPDMKQLTEIHPGNYAFYDAQQYTLGSCGLDDIAVTVATRVIGHYPRRNELLIDCGFAALTKQGMTELPSGCVIFRDETNLKLHAMTQEIGKVTTVGGDQLDWQKYPIGSMLFMYPWHSCATAAQHPVYFIVEKDQVVDTWRPCRGW